MCILISVIDYNSISMAGRQHGWSEGYLKTEMERWMCTLRDGVRLECCDKMVW